jgi:hypothetical protein
MKIHPHMLRHSCGYKGCNAWLIEAGRAGRTSAQFGILSFHQGNAFIAQSFEAAIASTRLCWLGLTPIFMLTRPKYLSIIADAGDGSCS